MNHNTKNTGKSRRLIALFLIATCCVGCTYHKADDLIFVISLPGRPERLNTSL